MRYIGVTTTSENQYAELVQTVAANRSTSSGPITRSTTAMPSRRFSRWPGISGIAVLVYAPFGRTRLWNRVAGRKVPDWAGEFDATTWAQFFLKYVASHPVVTATTPATSRGANMADNMGGAAGRLPDEAIEEADDRSSSTRSRRRNCAPQTPPRALSWGPLCSRSIVSTLKAFPDVNRLVRDGSMFSANDVRADRP